MKKYLRTTLLPLLCAIVFILQQSECFAVSSTIRISQVYGGGGNTGAIYQNDFIELFNASSSSVDISGWSIQYAAATSSTWHATNLSGSVPAGGYYLIQLASGGAVGLTLPTPDVTGTTNMSATDGKVALVNSTTVISNACPIDTSIIDMVGYGSTASCFEGAGAAPTASNTESVLRGLNGCLDTDNNSSDFSTATPAPRNSSSSANLCSSTGINDLSDLSPVSIWSSQNKLYIDLTGMKPVNAAIEIRNVLGQLLYNEKISSNGIYIKEMSMAESACLIVTVRNEDMVFVKRLAVLNW